MISLIENNGIILGHEKCLGVSDNGFSNGRTYKHLTTKISLLIQTKVIIHDVKKYKFSNHAVFYVYINLNLLKRFPFH